VRLALVARSEKNLQRVARACLQAGATVEIFPCDVTDEGAVAAMARAVYDIYSLGPRTVVEEIVLRPQLGDL
jgi:short-subunit dehydrogenase